MRHRHESSGSRSWRDESSFGISFWFLTHDHFALHELEYNDTYCLVEDDRHDRTKEGKKVVPNSKNDTSDFLWLERDTKIVSYPQWSQFAVQSGYWINTYLLSVLSFCITDERKTIKCISTMDWKILFRKFQKSFWKSHEVLSDTFVQNFHDELWDATTTCHPTNGGGLVSILLADESPFIFSNGAHTS